jgi:signal transduction histidine kinase
LLYELTVDFKQFEWWTFSNVQLCCVLFFTLSILNVPHQYVLALNVISILVTMQLNLLSNPKSFNVLVYWLGATPLFIALLTKARDTIFWSITIAVFITVNGIIIQQKIGPYPLTIHPDRFLVAGLLFLTTMSVMAVFFGKTQAKIREKLHKQNFELVSMTKEIEGQNSKLKDYNEHLEDRVHERTLELELQNKQLAEYAHINSHLLRAPLARILGIINLLSKTETTDEQKQYLDHLLKASKDLDEVVSKINEVLDKEGKIDREMIQKVRKSN